MTQGVATSAATYLQIADTFWPGQPALVLAADASNDAGARFVDLRNLGDDRPQYWCPVLPTHLDPTPRVLSYEERQGIKAHRKWKDAAGKKHEQWPRTSRWLTVEIDYLIYTKDGGVTDDVALLQRQACWFACQVAGLPVSLAVDSGNKSIHLNFCFSDDETTLKEFWGGTRHRYLMSLCYAVFGSIDHTVMQKSGRGNWTRFPGGLRDTGAEQTVLHVGQQITIAELEAWLRAQLIPEAFDELISQRTPIYKEISSDPRKYQLDHRDFRKDVTTPRGEGERGDGWRCVSNKLCVAGCIEPSMVVSGVGGQYPQFQASWLWHFASAVYNAYTDGWFYSTNPADWKDQNERVRWWHEWGRNDLIERATDRRVMPWDPDHAEEVERMMLNPGTRLLVEAARKNAAVTEIEEADQLVQEAAKKGVEVSDVLEQRAQQAMGGAAGGEGDGKGFGPLPHMRNFLGLDGAPCMGPGATPPVWDNRLKAWRMFNGRNWEVAIEEQIKGEVQRMMGLGYSQANIEKVYTKCKWYSSQKNERWEPNTTGTFPCANGTVYFDATTGRADFQPGVWRPEDRCDVFVPRNYVQGNISPRLHKFLSESFGEEAEYTLAKGVIGYCATPYQAYQCWFLLEGTGGNGKSVFMDLICKTYTEDNVAAVTMARLGGRFALQNICGKLVAYDDDASSLQNYRGDETDSIPSTIKRWSGGQHCEVDQKGLRATTMRISAKLFALVNTMPTLTDDTDGTWRRMMPFKWIRPLVNKDDEIPNFSNTLLSDDELDAFWSHCFDTFLHLVQNKQFRRTPGMEKRCHQYRTENDSVMAFAEHAVIECRSTRDVEQAALRPDTSLTPQVAGELTAHLATGKRVCMTIAALHDAYKKFCSDELGQSVCKGRKAFTKRLRAIYQTSEYTRQRRSSTKHAIYGSPDEELPYILTDVYCTHAGMTNLPGAAAQQGYHNG